MEMDSTTTYFVTGLMFNLVTFSSFPLVPPIVLYLRLALIKIISSMLSSPGPYSKVEVILFPCVPHCMTGLISQSTLRLQSSGIFPSNHIPKLMPASDKSSLCPSSLFELNLSRVLERLFAGYVS